MTAAGGELARRLAAKEAGRRKLHTDMADKIRREHEAKAAR